VHAFGKSKTVCLAGKLLKWRTAAMADLPSNIEDLLWQRTVEGDRVEYKAGWNPAAVMRSFLLRLRRLSSMPFTTAVMSNSSRSKSVSALIASKLSVIPARISRFAWQP
jgi:hypothetical protein